MELNQDVTIVPINSDENAMQLAALKSSRYDVTPDPEDFIRNRLFVDEAKKYPRVLECGCSNGFLSRLIAAGGSRVVGLEIDPEAAEEARRSCARVLSIDLNDSGWTKSVGEQFDLVTFGDVLEHLVDPQAVLRQAQQLLAPGGRVLICLPNIAFWTMRIKLLLGRWEYQSMGLLDYTHLRFFTYDTARKMIQAAGFNVLRFDPILGDRFTKHFRPVWQRMGDAFPNLLAFQMLFLVEPTSETHESRHA
jgi:2-polyprenyl-3-methyl-5-hydroxy-6-metoxy-1,4-benzoquinol methylase